MTHSDHALPGAAETEPTGGVSGKWLVVGMLAFAVAVTGALYVYWRLHVGPFLPLQRALAEEFLDSRPLVEGGQRKMHQRTPRILRITMKIDFDPNSDEPHVRALADRVAGFTARNYDLSTYEILELHFFWPEPEKEIREWSTERRLK